MNSAALRPMGEQSGRRVYLVASVIINRPEMVIYRAGQNSICELNDRMARMDINRSGEMEVFVHVVEQGGFSSAARLCRTTPSAVSKLIARLEARLGARLVNRSTRRFLLTPEGCTFYERATRLLADLGDAERSVGIAEQPIGLVRLTTSAPYANHILAPLL